MAYEMPLGGSIHRAEGPDDMPAHIRAALLPVSLQVPVQCGRMRLGTWQGVQLWSTERGRIAGRWPSTLPEGTPSGGRAPP
jgi:secondary thiamine-phosphate synthase enzyme